MSLGDDADLYGDLYGADDPDYTEGAVSVPVKEEPEPVSRTPPLPTKTEPDNSIPPKPSTAAGVASLPSIPAKPESSMLGNGNGKPQPIPSYSSQGAQQFQTNYKPAAGATQLGGGSDALVLGGGAGAGLGAAPQSAAAVSAGADGLAGQSVRPSQMKDEGKMFVGGLNWDTSDDGLRKYFSQFGKVDACTIMRDASGRSRGFAFLTFEDPAAVNAVMVREHYLDGKIIDPKRAIPRQEHHRTQKLFVGGLAPTVTTDSLRAYFSQFGKVVDATVMVDRDSSRSKGFGFVTFEDIDNVERLLGIGLLEIDGKLIDVKLAQPRGAMIAQREQQQQTQFSGNGAGNFNAGGMNGMNGGMGMSGGNMMNSMSAAASNASANGGSNGTPFDPQALASLYQRMFQQFGGAQGMGNMMQSMMGGGMGGMMNGMNGMNGMGGMGGMGMMGNMGAGMGGMGPMGAGMGMNGMNAMRGNGAGGNINAAMMGRGAGVMAGGGGQGVGPNVPRGPRAGTGATPPTGPAAMQGGGTGPMRAGNRGANNFHPYAR